MYLSTGSLTGTQPDIGELLGFPSAKAKAVSHCRTICVQISNAFSLPVTVPMAPCALGCLPQPCLDKDQTPAMTLLQSA